MLICLPSAPRRVASASSLLSFPMLAAKVLLLSTLIAVTEAARTQGDASFNLHPDVNVAEISVKNSNKKEMRQREHDNADSRQNLNEQETGSAIQIDAPSTDYPTSSEVHGHWTSSEHGPFAALSWAEFSSTVLMAPQDCSATHKASPSTPRALRDQVLSKAPKHFDWRDRGVVSPVKNQGHCGSCWTFSTTGAIEAHHAIKYGSWRTPTLSEQQLLDCAGTFDNAGCNGGLPSHAFEYISYAGGISEEFLYPYEAISNGTTCRFDGAVNNVTAGARVSTSFNITQGDEEEIQYHLLSHGPISIAFQVAPDFRKYQSGVFNSSTCKSGPQDVNHAVLVVGYGEDEDAGPYWTVKNSWSRLWGEEGYFRISKGKNMCGLAVCASYPVLM